MIGLILALISISQISADAIDDLRQEGLRNLTALAKAAESKIDGAWDICNETTLYISHATVVFYNDAQNISLTGQTELNTTAEYLTLQAILDNRPASVITCISKEQNVGYQKIQPLFDAFATQLEKDATAHDSDFASIVSTIKLIISQLQNVYDKNAGFISTCVQRVCVENNLNTAATEYDNLTSDTSGLVQDLGGYRREFNDNTIPNLYGLRNDVKSAADDAVKAMNKCL